MRVEEDVTKLYLDIDDLATISNFYDLIEKLTKAKKLAKGQEIILTVERGLDNNYIEKLDNVPYKAECFFEDVTLDY